MVVVTAVPGPELRAQLVGLGFGPSYGYTLPSGGTLHDAASLPATLKVQIQQAAAGPSTGNGSGASAGTTDPTGTPCTCSGGAIGTKNAAGACGCPPTTPWLLYGGIGVGVLLLGALLIRR